jgi:drug/metabolite transporter (DMT)-like permease
MIWFLFSALTALSESAKDVASKKSLKNTDEYIVSWSLGFFSLPFLVPLLFWVNIPALGSQFWVALLTGGSLNVIAIICYIKAIKCSDLSITVPLINFTPLFLLITSPVIIGEFPNFWGLIGSLLIVAGSYTLNIKEKHKGYLAPFRELLKERGPKLMLTVAFIWSITSNIDKIGVQNSSSIFWVIAINGFMALAMLPVMLYKSRRNIGQTLVGLKALILIGLFNGLAMLFQMVAISLTLVAYVISIKRTSSMLSVLLGSLLFKEKGIKERFTGAIIMVLGVLCITLS